MLRSVFSSRSVRLPALPALLAFLLLVIAGLPLSGQAQPQEQLANQERLVIHTAQGNFPFTVEVAVHPDERARGLMFRETMAANHGMLFVFGETRPVSMWMKNTPMSLDMVFVEPDGTVSSIAERTTPFSEAIINSGKPVSHVLELRAGVARMIGLKPGDRLEAPSFRK